MNAKALPRILLLVLAAASLVAGVVGGLVRLGAPLPAPNAASLHALLMIGGFLGTVISLERAVALGSPLAFAAPVASGSGALLILGGFRAPGHALLFAAPLLLAGASVAIARRQAQLHTVLLVVAALAWAVGNGLYLAGAPLDAAAAWWFDFLVLTIAAERLELTRLVRRPAQARPFFVFAVAFLLAASVALAADIPGASIAHGASLCVLAAWLATFDIARNTIRAEGFARYAAAALLVGYAWLAVAGFAWAMASVRPGWRDAAMHAFGLGFVFSMIFAHGPVIVPAVARVRVNFTNAFYVPLALLHASLLLRLAFGGDAVARLWGGVLNAAAIALFVATMLASMRRTTRPR
ncbi:hypothetical protein BWI17_21655 [Betaproteobacteria bacterium GR16-43]|nr:hypothetical protein BWI17_21655 [Betaproteobacteria bacterium GR16-43]